MSSTLAMDDDSEELSIDECRRRVEQEKYLRHKKSLAGRMAASIASGDSRMVAEAPPSQYSILKFYRGRRR